MCCLFITRRPRHPWPKDQAIPAKITENAEAIGGRIRRQRKDPLGLGNGPLAAKQSMPEARKGRTCHTSPAEITVLKSALNVSKCLHQRRLSNRSLAARIVANSVNTSANEDESIATKRRIK